MTIHVGGDDRDGCMGCPALLGLLFLFLLCSGNIKCNGNVAEPDPAYHQVEPQDEERENRAIDH